MGRCLYCQGYLVYEPEFMETPGANCVHGLRVDGR
jgi:hypothetical protein